MKRSISSARTPAIDVLETDMSYVVKAEFPGILKEDFDASVDDGVLLIEAKKREDRNLVKNNQMIRRERSYGKFGRSFHLGPNVDDHSIFAEYQDEILQVTLPKSKPPQSRKVEVTVS